MSPQLVEKAQLSLDFFDKLRDTAYAVSLCIPIWEAAFAFILIHRSDSP